MTNAELNSLYDLLFTTDEPSRKLGLEILNNLSNAELSSSAAQRIYQYLECRRYETKQIRYTEYNRSLLRIKVKCWHQKISDKMIRKSIKLSK